MYTPKLDNGLQGNYAISQNQSGFIFEDKTISLHLRGAIGTNLHP